jgi:fluoride exporter
MIGTLLRVVLAQLFGEECANPGTVGWLAAGSPLCITKNGETAAQEGGIVFADLPANLLGSFIMGLLQQGTVLGLPIDMPLGFLTPQNILQTMPILHVALRTGFCGSLTTYSSWNSEMIVMMFGTGREEYTFLNQLIRALFGYLIGVETALGSFEFGKTVAKWCNQWVNPILSAETVASEQRSAEGVYLNRHLPDLERRFLPDLPMENYGEEDYEANHPMECLERWRQSTVEVRRVGHALLPTLIEVETAVLVHGFEIQLETDSVARANHWEVDALREWALHKRTSTTATEGEDGRRQPLVNHDGVEHPHPFFTLGFAGSTVAVVSVGLLLCLLILNGQTSYQTTDRTTCYAMLFSPLGAILRWQLGQHLNGKWTTFSWLPIGTWAANFLASCLSIAMIATELNVSVDHPGFWTVGTLRAIRVGFSGSLSTVSTFAAEVSGLKKKDRAYTYVMISLTSTCLAGSAIYGLILFA